MGLFGDWTIEEAKEVGTKHRAVCRSSWAYERQLTIGKEYLITIEERILTCSPLCSFVGDNGKISAAHLQRFSKVKEQTNE